MAKIDDVENPYGNLTKELEHYLYTTCPTASILSFMPGEANVKVSADESLLSFVVNQASLEGVQQLVDIGVEINTLIGLNPLHSAVLSNNFAMVLFLIGLGADVNFTNKLGAPLHTALNTYSKYTIKIVEILCMHGANVNVQNEQGLALLHRVLLSKFSQEEKIELVKLLIDYGADMALPTKTGITSIQIAESRYGDELVGIMENQMKEKPDKKNQAIASSSLFPSERPKIQHENTLDSDKNRMSFLKK
jgi:hypothetical protein